jgi:hypothetical protein
MSETAREYLLHRFRDDAHSLRERADAMQRGTRLPGPDAATSARMADACDAVVAMLVALPVHADRARELDALEALIPLLDQRAQEHAKWPPVRAVYAGASTRIREVRSAELAAEHGLDVVTVEEEEDDDA